ncbi:putative transposase, partial [Halanaerobacter jeridensis]
MRTTIKAKLLEIPSEQSEKIDNLMLRFSSAIRFAFNRRKPDAYDPMNKGDLEKLLQSKYKLNSRYAKDAVMKADSIISSQKELVKEYHSNYKSKVKQVKQELKRAKCKQKIHALKTKLDKYQRKLEEYQKHLNEGTIPKVIFGGKENYKARCEGKISNQEWKELRNNKFCSRGDKTKKGNLNTRIV